MQRFYFSAARTFLQLVTSFSFINFHVVESSKWKWKLKWHHCGLYCHPSLFFSFLQHSGALWWAAMRERRQPFQPHWCPIKPKCSQPALSMLHSFLHLQQNCFDTTLTWPWGDRVDRVWWHADWLKADVLNFSSY